MPETVCSPPPVLILPPSTCMQSSKLPIEVCERVIDFLPLTIHIPTNYWKDVLDSIPTLYACSLVCRDWVPRSQHHLFRWVELRTTRQAYAFLDILNRSPHRASSVQCLTIWPRHPPSLPLHVASLSSHGLDSGSPVRPSSHVHTPPSYSVAPLPSSSPRSTPPLSPITDDQGLDAGETSLQPTFDIGGETLQSDASDLSELSAQLLNRAHNETEEISIPPCYYDWIYKVLTRLPPLLVKLSTLEFRELPTLHPSFIRLVSCFKAVKILTLWNLSDQSFSEMIQLVNRLPCIKSLHVLDCDWNQPTHFFPSKRLQLERLHFNSIVDAVKTRKDVLNWLGSLRDLSQFTAIDFFLVNLCHMTKMYRVLQRCMHSLRFLYLAVNVPSSDPFGKPYMSPMVSRIDNSLQNSSHYPVTRNWSFLEYGSIPISSKQSTSQPFPLTFTNSYAPHSSTSTLAPLRTWRLNPFHCRYLAGKRLTMR